MNARKDENLASSHTWLTTAATSLDLEPSLVNDLMLDILDLTRDVAHGPSRPAAPVTAFLLGLSVGRETSDAEETVALTKSQVHALQAMLKEMS